MDRNISQPTFQNRISKYYAATRTVELTPKKEDLRDEADKKLRDLAFVLKMTQRIKQEMLANV